jgi:hypothetical protein
VKGTVSRAYMLADPSHTNLAVLQKTDHVSVTLPASTPDNFDSVLVMETGD